MKISEELKSFLEDRSNRELLNNYSFKELYRKLLTQGMTPGITGEFTSLMYEIDVDPLLYLDEVPNKFLLYDENIKNVEIPTNIISIGGYAFYGCRSLTNITIPNSVTSIAYSAFCGCSSLTSITIPNSVTFIDVSVFENCSGLTSITIPDGVTSIGSSAFRGCSSLTSITIPNSVTDIGFSAFGECRGLKSVTMGNGVKSIGERAFRGCNKLTDITYEGTKERWDTIRKNERWKTDSAIKTIRCTDGDIKLYF